MRVVVIGGGIFGVCASLELRGRGHSVVLIERGSVPNAYSASDDISKVIRIEYGDDQHYTQLMVEAFKRWDCWNEELGETVYHNTGVLILKQSEIKATDFEALSQEQLRKNNVNFSRVNSEIIGNKYPAWNNNLYIDGHYNPLGGWAESGKVLKLLAKKAEKIGVEIIDGEVEKLIIQNGIVRGAVVKGGKSYFAEKTLVSSGAWTPFLLPHVSDIMWPTGQIVFHFQIDPNNIHFFCSDKFPTYMADISRTGFYGFPCDNTGRLKIGHHGPGYPLSNLSNFEIEQNLKKYQSFAEKEYQKFIDSSLPFLKGAKKIYQRLCIYCDTFDGNFLITKDPNYQGLYIAAGGSGHGFKFGPVLGEIIADIVEDKKSQWSQKFGWRTPTKQLIKESSRYSPIHVEQAKL